MQDRCCGSQPRPQTRWVAELQQPFLGSGSSFAVDKLPKTRVFPREKPARSPCRSQLPRWGSCTLPCSHRPLQHVEEPRGKGRILQG